jgi:hypothetical protein
VRTFRLKVLELHTVEHIVHVPDRFNPYPEEELDDWANEIGEQNSSPTETFEVQIQRVLEAEEVKVN